MTYRHVAGPDPLEPGVFLLDSVAGVVLEVEFIGTVQGDPLFHVGLVDDVVVHRHRHLFNVFQGRVQFNWGFSDRHILHELYPAAILVLYVETGTWQLL